MISVIIPLYNKERQIERTLRSLQLQTFRHFEVIIVDDGSTDKSVEKAKQATGLSIHIIRQRNAGVSAARNTGINHAKYDLIAFLDADDEWKPQYLETQYSLYQRYPDCSVYACNYEFEDLRGKVTSSIIRGIPFSTQDGILSNYFAVACYSHPPICSISVMVKKSAIGSIGGFPTDIRSGEDLLTWARLACRYKIAYCRQALAIFHVEGYDFSEKPKRFPAEPDNVSKELEKLADTFSVPYIKKYIALWHKMRSSIYMRLHYRRKSITEALKALKYDPLNIKLYAYILLNLLPSRLQPF